MASGDSPPAKAHPRLRCRDLLEPYCREVLRQRGRVRRRAEAEPVHDLRVASRRLQEALAILEPFLAEGPSRRLHRRARRIRRSLGELRNADVMVDLASDLMRRLPVSERASIRPFLARLKAEATGLRRRSVHRGGFPVPGIRKRIDRLVRGVPTSQRSALDSRGNAILTERLRKVSGALDRARRDGPAALHRLRIAVKRYRYALEFLEKAGRREIREAIEETRRLQSELGRLHDLDVLLEILRKTGTSPGIRRLLLRLHSERRRQLRRTRDALRRSPDLLARLSATLHPRSAA